MLMAALNEEVDGYLGRGRYQRDEQFRGYRNGTTSRRLTLGSGTVGLDQPRLRDVPGDQEPFDSKILRKYQRRSDTIDETFMKLFIEGLATRDFEPSLRLLMGRKAPLSASVISRLTQQFRGAYESFEQQDLKPLRFVYIWADGIVRHEALWNRVGCKDPPLVCRSKPMKLEAA
jgi:transposase-like protein